MRRILIVDDESIVKKWIQLVFEPVQAEFVLAGFVADGREALAICLEQPIDIVITDIIMPGMDGMTFIQQLRGRNLRTQVIILSNHADFSVAQQGMLFGAAEYLLKAEVTGNELIEAVRRVDEKLRLLDGAAPAADEAFLGIPRADVVALIGDEADSETARLFTRRLGEREPGGAVVAAFCLDRAPGGKETGAYHGSELVSALAGAAGAQGVESVACTLSDNIVLMLLLPPPGDIVPVIECIAKAVAPHTLSAGLYGCVADIPTLHAGVALASAALRMRFFYGPGALLQAEALPAAPSGFDLHARLAAARRLIAASDFAELQSLLTAISSEKPRFTPEDIDPLRRFVIQTADQLLAHLHEHFPESALPPVDPLGECAAVEFLDELLDWLHGLIRRCEALHRAQPSSAQMAKVTAYIDRHYMEDLSLAAVSEIAGFHPNYFCILFKECTGQSFHSYLTAVRVERAKHLLATTGKSVQLIAQLTGYESDSYFIRVFKARVGMTPNRFRHCKRAAV